MRATLNILLLGIMLSSGVVVGSQDYVGYEFRGVPPCDAEMKEYFLEFLLDVAAVKAIGETPAAYAETVKNEAKAQLRDQLESRSSIQRSEAQNAIVLGLRTQILQYRPTMKLFWDSPVLCREALETVQLLSEYQVYAQLVWQFSISRNETFPTRDTMQTVNDEVIPDPHPRFVELVEFFTGQD